jgi:ion channel POLLUX/CASTOR
MEGGLALHLKNLKLMHHHGNPVMRRHLEMLPLESFDSILILAEQSVWEWEWE